MMQKRRTKAWSWLLSLALVLALLPGMGGTAKAEVPLVWTNGNVTATLEGTKLTVKKTESADNGNMGDSGWTHKRDF